MEAIFKMKLDGIGNKRILKELNTNPIYWKKEPREVKSKTGTWENGGWSEGYLNLIIYRNRKLIGEKQHKKSKGDKRITDPSLIPVSNFYPSIDKNLWQKVQDLIEENKKKRIPLGGKSKTANNLFSGILKCRFCGSSVHYNGGNWANENAYGYLQCSASRYIQTLKDGSTCDATPINYREFEKSFFEDLEKMDLDKLLPTKSESSLRILQLKVELDDLEQRAKKVTKERENLLEFIMASYKNTEKPEHLTNQYKELEKQDADIVKRRKQVIEEINVEQNAHNNFIEQHERVLELNQYLKSKTDIEKTIENRKQIHIAIKHLCEKIVVTPFHDRKRARIELSKNSEKILNSINRLLINTHRRKLEKIENEEAEGLPLTRHYGGLARIYFTAIAHDHDHSFNLRNKNVNHYK